MTDRSKFTETEVPRLEYWKTAQTMENSKLQRKNYNKQKKLFSIPSNVVTSKTIITCI